MTRQALPRKRVAAALCSLVAVEWILFEFLRAPYRPPQDMTTFLGTEKYAVIGLRFSLAVIGCALLSRWTVRFSWTSRDVTVLALAASVLMVATSTVVIAPSWQLLHSICC